jgi:hypothetical protein
MPQLCLSHMPCLPARLSSTTRLAHTTTQKPRTSAHPSFVVHAANGSHDEDVDTHSFPAVHIAAAAAASMLAVASPAQAYEEERVWKPRRHHRRLGERYTESWAEEVVEVRAAHDCICMDLTSHACRYSPDAHAMLARCGRCCNILGMHAWQTCSSWSRWPVSTSCCVADLCVMCCLCVQREEQERSAQRLEQERLAELDRKKQEMVRDGLCTQVPHTRGLSLSGWQRLAVPSSP